MDVEIDGEWMLNCKVMAAYVPEMALTDSDPSNPRPEFTVDIDNVTADHTVVLDNYSGGQPVQSGHLDAVLRNHIYRFILKGNSAKLTTDFQVLPWDMVWDDTPTFFEYPDVSEYISWVTTVLDDPDDESSERENGYRDNTDELKLTMKPSTDEYAECTFTLSKPVNAKWVAYLRWAGGETDAFYFTTGEKDETDGSDYYFVQGGDSGRIDGTTPVTLKIACKRGVVS